MKKITNEYKNNPKIIMIRGINIELSKLYTLVKYKQIIIIINKM